jgi:5-methylcytosine-specific restriction enzyme A
MSPQSALRPCAYPGCSQLVVSGRCARHAQAQTREFRRDPARQRLYGHGWKTVRKNWLAQHPWCETCAEQGYFVPATDVHHVERHEGDQIKFITSPLMSLCHACHSRETALEVRRGGALKSFQLGDSERSGPAA